MGKYGLKAAWQATLFLMLFFILLLVVMGFLDTENVDNFFRALDAIINHSDTYYSRRVKPIVNELFLFILGMWFVLWFIRMSALKKRDDDKEDVEFRKKVDNYINKK